MNTLEEILEGVEEPSAFLVGAGVSMDAPSSLPNAQQLIADGFKPLQDIIGNEFSDINTMLSRSKEFPTRPGEFLRFEVAMSTIDKNVRSTILEQLHGGSPNSNHFALAQLLHRGHVVITTNFDTHIEDAYEILYNKKCAVAYDDEDYNSLPGSSTEPTLWKIHGTLDDKESLRATFTSVLATSSKRIQWFRQINELFDILVLGYSGSDDLDLIPPLARVISSKKIIWVDHSNSTSFFIQNSREWFKNRKEVMHLDCIGLSRIFFSAQAESRGSRQYDLAIYVSGNTKVFLEKLIIEQGLDPITIPSNRRKKNNLTTYDLPNEHEFVDSMINVMKLKRDPKVKELTNLLYKWKIENSLKGSPEFLLKLLVTFFNSPIARMVYKNEIKSFDKDWGLIAERDLNAIDLKLDALQNQLKPNELSLWFRLKGCIHSELSNKYIARDFFEKSIIASQDIYQELGSLLAYWNYLYPSHYPIFWLNRKEFPHLNRMYYLIDYVGFYPELESINLIKNLDFANKLIELPESLNYTSSSLNDVFKDTFDIRRSTIDYGDVLGELQATYVIAKLTTVAEQHHGRLHFKAATEWQRISVLEEELRTNTTPKKSYRSTVSKEILEDVDYTLEEMRESMFSIPS